MGKQNTTHGHAADGMPSSEYVAWRNMLDRCRNKNAANYRLYGGRGITVCERWNEFEYFLADMGRKPSPELQIDRIDNDGNYEPGNCHWATPIEQANNTGVNHLITIYGRTQTLVEWAREANILPVTLRRRITAGWDPEWALVPFPGMALWEG